MFASISIIFIKKAYVDLKPLICIDLKENLVSYLQEYNKNIQNCISHNISVENIDNWITFNNLMNNQIIKSDGNGKFGIIINSDTNRDNLIKTASFSFPEIAYLSIQVNDCNMHLAEFLRNNKIPKMNRLVLEDTNSNYCKISQWLDEIVKYGQRVTENVELFGFKIDFGKFSNFLTDLKKDSETNISKINSILAI